MTQNQFQQKQVNLRLSWFRHVQEVPIMWQRHADIIRTYYLWWNRYQEQGIEGLKDRSKKPMHDPRATKPEIIEKIVY